MGVDIYHLQPGAVRRIRIGGTTHEVGVISRMWKITETDLRPGRADTLEALEDVQAAGTSITPPVVLVDALHEFGIRRDIRAYRLLRWDAGRVMTQDMDWDHLPTAGWAVDTGFGPLIVHEEAGDRLIPLSELRAREAGIIGQDGRLAGYRLPVIVECLSVKTMHGGFYGAECVLGDGRSAYVLGESESGDLPPAAWFVGHDTGSAARYGLADQLAGKSGAAG